MLGFPRCLPTPEWKDAQEISTVSAATRPPTLFALTDILLFVVPPHKIKHLWHIFTQYDTTGSGFLVRVSTTRCFRSFAHFHSCALQQIDEFCRTMLKYPRNPIVDAIPSFLGELSLSPSLHQTDLTTSNLFIDDRNQERSSYNFWRIR